MEAFVYQWTDNVTRKVYVGYHKGTPDDGYISSGQYLLEEYYKRPNDFTREILFVGSAEEAFFVEQKLIKELVKTPEQTYNKRFGGQAEPWNKGKSDCYSQETIQKLSTAALGRKHTSDTKTKISLNNYNRGRKGNWQNAIKPDHYLRLKDLFKGQHLGGDLECPHCRKVMNIGNAKRWHFDKCKVAQ
jgi:hypothetical protein